MLFRSRVAEEVFFGVDNVTSGASSDFQQATRLAKAMVTQWGFSSKLGIQYNGDPKDKMSGETQALIDNEVRELLNDSYARATNMINEHKRELKYIANALIEHETLSGSEIRDVANGYKVNLHKRSQAPSRHPIVLPSAKVRAPVAASVVHSNGKTAGGGNNSSVEKEKGTSKESVGVGEGSKMVKEEKGSKQVRGPPPL